ncbi:MAG: YtxH domain-containing protein [Candidatus Aminicenantes bacterium]|nr:YtxH domain-containing protein [Candidatus Aminicenantes bacterium]
MAEHSRSCWGAVIYSFFSGALLGAGLALLLAPVSGKEVRNAIGNEFDEFKDKLKKMEEKLHKSGAAFNAETGYEEEF